MIQFVPSVLARSEQEFKQRLEMLVQFSPLAQIDVLNDSLVPGTSYVNMELLAAYAQRGMRFEIHLMVDAGTYDVAMWLQPWVSKIILHVEGGSFAEQTIIKIRNLGVQVFCAINPETDLSFLDQFVAHVDGVMFMTVMPGAMGGEFRPDVISRIHMFHQAHPHVPLEADGGVTPATAPLLAHVGVSIMAVGSFITGPKSIERWQELQRSVPV